MYAEDEVELLECEICERKFNSGAYKKHVKVCEKVFVKKRKQFNAKE